MPKPKKTPGKKPEQLYLFKGMAPPPKKKRGLSGKQLISNARKTAFEIANAVEIYPELNKPHRKAVHLAHLFVNSLKKNAASGREAVDLLEASKKLMKSIKQMEKDRKTGQPHFDFEGAERVKTLREQLAGAEGEIKAARKAFEKMKKKKTLDWKAANEWGRKMESAKRQAARIRTALRKEAEKS